MANETKQTDNGASSDEVDYAFIVVKRKDGPVTIQPLNEDAGIRTPDLQEIYSACAAVLRNVQTQETATAVVTAITQVFKDMKMGKNKKGIVLPK